VTDRSDAPSGLTRRALLRAALGGAVAAVAAPTLVHAVPPPSPMVPVTWIDAGLPPDPGPGAVAPLPACRYKDVPALGDPRTDWATMVLDTRFTLGPDDRPRKLVPVGKAGIGTVLGARIIPEAIDDLRALHEASVAAGAEVVIRTAYRSYAQQATVFGSWVATAGEKAARNVSARPGHSEHQLGSALDFAGAGDPKAPWEHDDWATTKPGKWLMRHAWEHGFVLSYPDGMTDRTCYAYEPWHYRYVGRELAAAIEESGLTPREYLWATYWGREGA
jgi:D-alanyl-D-alanine carboxypeptidase